MARKQVNPHKRNLRSISLVVFVYVVSAVLLHDLRRGNLPALADTVVGIYTAPLRVMFQPLFPLLKPFNMVVSDGAELPTPYGIIAGSIVYVFVLTLLAVLFTPKQEKPPKFKQHWDG